MPIDSMRTVEGWIAWGLWWWQISYRLNSEDRRALEHVRAAAEDAPVAERTRMMLALTDLGMGTLSLGLAKWVHGGCPRVIPRGHKYAAALMCTGMNPAVPVRPPWRAFVVDIPDRLIPLDGPDAPSGWILRALVCVFDSSEGERWNVVGVGDNGMLLSQTGLTYSAFAEDQEHAEGGAEGPFMVPFDAADSRSALLLRRYVVGLCVDVGAQALDSAGHGGTTGPQGEPPRLRVFRAGRPVEVDCRETVAAFVSGKRGAPSVNWMVRGHYRNQACGPRLSERRVIWIEPHWGNNKAGAAAPIALRPHTVGPKRTG